MKGIAVLFGGLMLLAARANAQDVLSFDDIPIKNEPTIEVNLGPEMLKLLGEASKGEAGAPGVTIEGITNVRLRMYEDVGEEMTDVLAFVDTTAKRLDAAGWAAVVRIRDGSDVIRVYMKPGTGGKLAGVTFMMTSGGGNDDDDDDDDDDGSGEVMFINVTGAFLPGELGQLAAINGVTGAIGVLGIVPGADAGNHEERPSPAQD